MSCLASGVLVGDDHEKYMRKCGKRANERMGKKSLQFHNLKRESRQGLGQTQVTFLKGNGVTRIHHQQALGREPSAGRVCASFARED